MDKKGILLGVCFLLVLTNSASANPITAGPPISLVLLSILAFEGFLLSCLLGLVNFRFLAFSILWLAVTYVTFLVFRSIFMTLCEITDSSCPVWIGEIVVILAEAKLIELLSRISIFDFHDTGRPLHFMKAFGYSAVINVGSILAGLLIL